MRADDLLEIVGPEEILVKGTRVPIDCVIDAWRRGLSAEEIAAEYTSVALPRVYALIAHYLANRKEVESYLAAVEAGQERRSTERLHSPTKLGERLRILKAQRASDSGSDR